MLFVPVSIYHLSELEYLAALRYLADNWWRKDDRAGVAAAIVA